MNSLYYQIQSSIEPAISKAQSEQKPLIVYAVGPENSDRWLASWIDETAVENLKSSAVILKLIEGSQEFDLFKAMLPEVLTPALHCMFKNQYIGIIEGNLSEGKPESFREKLEEWLSMYEGEGDGDDTDADLGSSNIVNNSPTNGNTDGAGTVATSVNQQHTEVREQNFQQTDNSSIQANRADVGQGDKNFKRTTSPQDLKIQEHVNKLHESERKYHQELLKQQQKNREEKMRVEYLLKQDKMERQSRMKESMSNSKQQADRVSEPASVIKDNISYSKLLSDKCVLAIKLTNGVSLKNTFNSKDRLNDVRKWVDANRSDGDFPYLFHRNIPRLTFGDGDEMKSLQDLELPPRSVLILRGLQFDSSKKIADATNMSSPGLLTKLYSGVSNWWGGAYTDASNETPASSTTNTAIDSTDIPQIDDPNVDELFQKEVSPSPSFRSHSTTPNVHQLSLDDENDNEQRETYNGNTINLEDDKKKKD